MKALLLLLSLLLTPLLLAQTSEADALAFVAKHHPSIHEKITSLKSTDPDAYASALGDAQKAAADYARILATQDAEASSAFLKMYGIDFAAITLSDQYLAATSDSERATIKEQLRGKIAESFDQWLIVERARIRRLETELARAKAALEASAKNREQAIGDDTDSLIEESRRYHAEKGK